MDLGSPECRTNGDCALSGAGMLCFAGVCACATGRQVLCAGACRDLSSDASHCGACGHACGPDEGCLGGVCTAEDGCASAPSSVISWLANEDLRSANDFAFDGAGGFAVALGSRVVRRRAGSTEVLTDVMPGEVVALRYTRSSGLMLAVVTGGGGAVSGAIYRLGASPTPTLWQGGLRRPAGLTVGPTDVVWFSDRDASAVYRRAVASDVPAVPVITDIPSPTHILLDPTGRYLYIARADTNTVMRQELDASGAARGSPQSFVGGFSRVSGLAHDECDNLYVADEIVDRIWRVPSTGGGSVRITVDVRGPRSLQFGVGASFGGRDLFALSSNDGTMRGLAVGVRGAPTVVPAP